MSYERGHACRDGQIPIGQPPSLSDSIRFVNTTSFLILSDNKEISPKLFCQICCVITDPGGILCSKLELDVVF